MILLEINLSLLLPILFLALIVIFLMVRIYKMRHMLSSGGGPETSEHIIELTDQNFNKITGRGLSLVDFWAPWCAPCRIQGPIVNELANEMHAQANICKMDVDQNKKTAGKFGIRSIPTIMIFKDGKMVKQLVGVKPKNTLIKEIQAFL